MLLLLKLKDFVFYTAELHTVIAPVFQVIQFSFYNTYNFLYCRYPLSSASFTHVNIVLLFLVIHRNMKQDRPRG